MAMDLKKRGVASLSWGTDNVAAGNIANAIVESVRRTPIKKRNKVPNNNGFTVRTTDVNDGEALELVCVYDANITWPEENEIVSLRRPKVAATANSNTTNFEVIEIEDVGTREKEGSITIRVERYEGINY